MCVCARARARARVCVYVCVCVCVMLLLFVSLLCAPWAVKNFNRYCAVEISIIIIIITRGVKKMAAKFG